MYPKLLERLSRGDVLVADGAQGTFLYSRGLPMGDSPEAWSLDHEGVLEEIAGLYLEAGAEIIQSNSFGASPLRLAQFGLENRCEDINRRAVEAVRRAVGVKAFVAASVGPSGRQLGPPGEGDAGRILDGFRKQIAALAVGGADLICIETMTQLAEALLAVEAAKTEAPGLPVLASMTFDATPRGFLTLAGNSIPEVTSALAEAGADVLGSNCGIGAEAMLEVAKVFHSSCKLPLIFQPNAGLPRIEKGNPIYEETPKFMAEKALAMIEAGAQIIGGCCGTGPEHILAIRMAVDGA